MGTIYINCPTTGKSLSTGMGADEKSFETLNLHGNSVDCPHCGKVHVWDKKDATLKD